MIALSPGVTDRPVPFHRSEQEIAGYRDVLGLIHANQTNIPFEPRYVEQPHGNLYRYVGDTTAGLTSGPSLPTPPTRHSCDRTAAVRSASG